MNIRMPIRFLRDLRLQAAIARRAREYETPRTEAERRAWHLEQLNHRWAHATAQIPHYRELVRSGRVPRTFGSVQEFVETVPATTRTDVQQDLPARVDPARPAELKRTSGGSTAQPVTTPAWKSEPAYTRLNTWMARGWYGIRPSSRLALIWGHSHLLGSGWRGRVNGLIRQSKDAACGYLRLSAYDLSVAHLEAMRQRLETFRPEYIVGYSAALDALARAHEGRDLSHLKVRAVIATGEGFPAEDSSERLQALFNCPVAMEYGAVETYVMAHQHPEGAYRTFWRSYFLEAVEPGTAGGAVLRVTSLYPRAFPLFRYEIGDEVETCDEEDGYGVSRLKRVIGRCNDFITLPDGERIHSITLFAAVSQSIRESGTGILRFQIVQSPGATALHVVPAPNATGERVIETLRARLRAAHPRLARLHVQAVAELQQSLAGKTPTILKKSE